MRRTHSADDQIKSRGFPQIFYVEYLHSVSTVLNTYSLLEMFKYFLCDVCFDVCTAHMLNTVLQPARSTTAVQTNQLLRDGLLSMRIIVYWFMCYSYVGQIVPLPGSADSPVFPLSTQSSQSCHFGSNLLHVRRRDVLHDLPRPPPDNKGREQDSMSRGWSNTSKVQQENKVGGSASG